MPREGRYANITKVNHIDRLYPARVGKALFLALFCCIIFAAAVAIAAPSSFVHGRASLRMDAGKLTLSLPVSVDNEDALGEMLRDGSTMELAINISIARKRSLWFSKGIHEASFSYLLRHDPLSREYRMTTPGTEQAAHDKSLRQLLTNTWKTIKLPIADKTLFSPDNDYIVKIELSLRHTALPPWLDRTLVFWNKDVVKPLSLELEYRMKDAPIPR